METSLRDVHIPSRDLAVLSAVVGTGNSGSDSQNHSEQRASEHQQLEETSVHCNSEDIEEIGGMEQDMDLTEDNYRAVRGQFGGVTEPVNVVDKSSTIHASPETVTMVDVKLNIQNGDLISNNSIDGNTKSGIKRPRITSDEVQPSVHVSYKNLTRASKQKLEQQLQEWSEWEAKNNWSAQDQDQVLESGEETYFPALQVGLENTPSVPFWIDNRTVDQQMKGHVPVDSSSVPFYDRGFSLGLTSEDGGTNLEGGLEIIEDPPRCFNCGSYSHALRECLKPRDNVAVNSARKIHKAKRSLNNGPRLPVRYYQNTHSGKFEGLQPGVLSAETQKVLGLGELDPPPWLNRMREIGYPPGYLAPDDEDLSSGITIFGDEEEGFKEEETEDGEILEKQILSEPPKKMTVKFPGINAPIPENAVEKFWSPAPSSSSESYRNRWQNRSTRGHFHEPRSYRDDRHEGPPGVEPSSYPPRYAAGGFYDRGYGLRDDTTARFRSPTSDRTQTYGFSRYSSSSSSFSGRNKEYDLDFRDLDDHEPNRHWSSRR